MNKYEIFIKVIETGSLTKASEELGCTQSAISHCINGIEEELGFQTIKRGHSGITLTNEGEMILPAIRALVNSNEQIKQKAAAIRGLELGTIRIGTFTSVAVHWLPSILKDFEKDFPNVEIKLFNGDYGDVESWINDGTIDLGFITVPSNLDCKIITLKEDKLFAIVSKDSKFALYPKFPISECEREPFISLLQSSDHDARRALDAAGVKPNVKFYTKDDYAIIAMVEQGLGISIMPELLLKGRKDNLVVLPLVPESKRTIGLAIAAGEKAGPAVKKFADYTLNYVLKNEKGA